MATFNNNGTIALSFEYKGKRFVLSGLGSYSDTKQLEQVKQTELRIKTDRKANNFPFENNESVKLFYFPSSEDRQQMIALMSCPHNSIVFIGSTLFILRRIDN